MEEIKEIEERVILVSASNDEDEDIFYSLQELKDLAKTAGATSVGTLIQKRQSPSSATYIGKGKVDELRELIKANDANGIITDDELSPAQMRNLENELDCKVMDRTLVILDIFAQRARSKEGKIQVELAQLKYNLTRLTGFGKSMSRLGGGIGTRGPGEKKLEQDRRIIRDRISALKAELREITKHRELLRNNRDRQGKKVFAIVGYTNAGKSTLLNTLTEADVLAQDKLFATLDTTTRLLTLKDGNTVLLIDTVGFIQKLPHQLIEAFKSTLEEASYADFILHVVDRSNKRALNQMKTVYEILDELNITGKKTLTIYNKIDKDIEDVLVDPMGNETVSISCKTLEGIEELKEKISDMSFDGMIVIERVFPYSVAGKIQIIRDKGIIIEEKYVEDGIYIKGKIPKELYYLVTD